MHSTILYFVCPGPRYTKLADIRGAWGDPGPVSWVRRRRCDKTYIARQDPQVVVVGDRMQGLCSRGMFLQVHTRNLGVAPGSRVYWGIRVHSEPRVLPGSRVCLHVPELVLGIALGPSRPPTAGLPIPGWILPSMLPPDIIYTISPQIL